MAGGVIGRALTVAILVSSSPNRVSLYYHGAYLTAKVYTPAEHKYLKHMLPMEIVDHSKALRCPMPGQLISLSVKEGDAVEVGQVS
jgi:propionyl-CoA carboxylase alpha chain